MYQRDKNVEIEIIDEESVVVQKEEKTIILNETAYYIYDNIERYNNLEELVDAFIKKYNIVDVDSKQILEDFNVVTTNLMSEGLLV